jgi:hypothetical protein
MPNRRWLVHRFSGSPTATSDLTNLHQAAAHLLLDGAFNVNSTSIEAWKSLLAATRGRGNDGGGVFPRLDNAPAGDARDGEVHGDKLWAGRRELSDAEIGRLATAVVEEVKKRGPFLGLADFVNRRLAGDDTGRAGTLQAAIDNAGLNHEIETDYPLDNSHELPNYQHPDHIADPTLLDQRLKPSTVAWGAPAHLTQGDLLGVIGPVLAARSDSFLIRAYGDSVDNAGRVLARAWCEAAVQRVPEPVAPDAAGLNPRIGDMNPTNFGRKFAIRRFRWLNADEV